MAQECTWLTRDGVKCKRLCRWPGNVCGVHERQRNIQQMQELHQLIKNAHPKAKPPRGFFLWHITMQISWFKQHQKKAAALLVMALLLIGVPAIAQELADVQTICVTWPHGEEGAATRKQVGELLEKQGHRVADCVADPNVAYDAQLWFYPYGGQVQSETTYFYATYATAPNIVVGSYATDTPTLQVAGWEFSLWPRGTYHSIYRDPRASNIEQGIKHLTKVLAKARKDRRKER